MNPAHHLNRSRHYLNITPANISAGDYARDTRRRLRLVVKAPVFVGSVPFQREWGITKPPETERCPTAGRREGCPCGEID